MRKHFLRRAIPLTLLLSLAGCLPNRPFRVGTAAIEPRENGVRDYDIGFIEFDEQGDFWDRQQLASAVNLLKGTSRPLLVVYVHGWQNNASEQTTDVPQFRQTLEKLARTEQVRALHYQVVGVYLGWRGKQAYDPLFKVLSFKNRKDAAVRIGSSNTITEAIFRVVYEARRHTAARTILIGHSFGALVVERAVEQAMTGGVLTGKPVVPADFILLINSAAESIYAKEMRDMMAATLSFDAFQKCYKGPDATGCFMKDEPRIVSVTSETDSATGVAFPIGATVFGVGKLYRDYPPEQTGGKKLDQRLFFTHTQGHNDFLLDHAIVPLEIPPPETHNARAFEENLAHPQALPASGADRQATPIFATGDGPPNEWKWWRLNYTGNAQARSPFWVVKVPKQILNGHGNIFNPAALDLYAALFRTSNVLDQENPQPPEITVKKEPASVGQPLAAAQTLAAPAPAVAHAVATPEPSPNESASPAPPTGRKPRKARQHKTRSPYLQQSGRVLKKKSL